jgi:xanthine dehydrogenase YagT iron-sulfur-binding subunit
MNDPRNPARGAPGLSRRDFLRGSGAGVAATALAHAPGAALAKTADAPKAADVPGAGPAPAKVTLTVNGAKMSYAVEPRVTLLDLLRNHLDVTGCKRVCDRGSCGACTVLLDGKPTRSCTTRVGAAEGKAIRTIEGLANGDNLHPVQQAFLDHDAMQCGYCTAGMIMSAVALLHDQPKPERDDINQFMSGNICRCGTYARIVAAIEQAAKVTKGGGQ